MTPPRIRRVLVTGSRDWTDEEAVYQNLFREHINGIGRGFGGMVVVHGACPTGADAIADRWAERCGPAGNIRPERHPAQWRICTIECRHPNRVRGDGTPYCPQAGPRRNQHMVDLGADVCISFPLPQSRGTHDCVKRALAAGIPVLTVSAAVPA